MWRRLLMPTRQVEGRRGARMVNQEVHSTLPRPAAVEAAVLDSATEDGAVAAERVPAAVINPVAVATGPAAVTVPAAAMVLALVARAVAGQGLLIPAFVNMQRPSPVSVLLSRIHSG